jgi:hypothetical protein
VDVGVLFTNRKRYRWENEQLIDCKLVKHRPPDQLAQYRLVSCSTPTIRWQCVPGLRRRREEERRGVFSTCKYFEKWCGRKGLVGNTTDAWASYDHSAIFSSMTY